MRMMVGELFTLDENRAVEAQLRRRGLTVIAGVDEVGRGCIAGPVVAAAVVLRNHRAQFVADIDDSKKLAPAERERLDRLIRRHAVAVGVGVVDNRVIDDINILQASFEAMRIALGRLVPQAEFLLVDGKLKLPGVAVPQLALVQGDSRSKSIGAASIVAKVYRDRLMTEWHERFPMYRFASNKGYGTAEHWAALRAHGPCELHRLSFRGVAGGDEAAFEQMELDPS